MRQLSITQFGHKRSREELDEERPEAQHIHLPNDSGQLIYLPTFLDQKRADALLEDLSSILPWKVQTITLYGKTMLQPRRICYLSAPEFLDTPYSYSRQRQIPINWDSFPVLLELKASIEAWMAQDTDFGTVNNMFFSHL